MISTFRVKKLYVCVYSNSRNDVPRVAQRYGTIVVHTRRRASVLVVFVVFCMHMYSFAGLIRRNPPPTFSDTAITDRHSDTSIFQLRAHWVHIFLSIVSNPRLPLGAHVRLRNFMPSGLLYPNILEEPIFHLRSHVFLCFFFMILFSFKEKCIY